jgi:hypothetical protein
VASGEMEPSVVSRMARMVGLFCFTARSLSKYQS